MRGGENWGMSERLILALMATWVARVTGDCGKPPQVEHGVPTKEFFSQTSFPVGTRLFYECDPGYIFKEGGSKSITCGPDSHWGPLKVVCEPRNCGNPGEILNGNYEANGTTLGNRAIFKCNQGYEIVGRTYRTCLASGWDGQVPTCEIVKCHDPVSISNGKVSSPTTGDEWQYGMIATYLCLDGYTLIGDAEIVCTSSGQWNKKPPLCKVVSCQRPPLPENSKIVYGFGPVYGYRETITFSCNPGYVMVGSSVIECSEDNTFVPSPPICKLPPIPTALTTTTTGTAATTPLESVSTEGTTVTTAGTPTSKNTKGIIIGIIVGVIVLVLILVGICCFCKKKRSII